MKRSIALAKRQGIIFILSAPSGAGKTTLYNGLKEIYPEIKLSVSCTTRAQRSGELNGRDYRFLPERQFKTLNSFFFNDTATTEIYTLSLHDALPIPTRKTSPAWSCPGLPSACSTAFQS